MEQPSTIRTGRPPRALPPVGVFATVLAPFALHGAARELDGALGLLLHTTLDVPGLALEVFRVVDPARLVRCVVLWTLTGGAVWATLAAWRSRRESIRIVAALEREAGVFSPLLLRPALTLLALLALALRPTYPYGFTLPVALTQDWDLAQDAAALAAIVALRAPAPRLPAPSAAGVFLITFVTYALLSPAWARDWDGHPGNEPKTLRMAVAIGHGLTLDVEPVSGAMEELPVRPFPAALRDAALGLARHTEAMLDAVRRGPVAVGAAAIQAERVSRQTVRGKDGGVYHVLAPGPSLLLAPALRVDRALNLVRGRSGSVAVALLLWNALAAAGVAAVFVLARDATARPGLAALLACGFGLAPPYLFYFYQFYPEALGALALALILRMLLFARRLGARATLGTSLLLAFLPWLHQKFLPVWALLVAMAVLKAVDQMVTLRTLLTLLVPQAASLFLTAVYNFAITGSVRPDALFLAWGPAGVSSERVDEGFLGLLLDARYGILPYAPVYILAAAGWLAPGPAARRLRLALPAALLYYVTVAAADNWSGAVCSLGRYFMPVAPLMIALVGVALERSSGRRGVLAVALALCAWTACVALPLWRDPHAANDCALLLARSEFADGDVYVPNLFFRSANFAAPGHAMRVSAWVAALLLVALWVRRAAQGRGGARPLRTLAACAATVLLAGALLERWPSRYGSPRFHDAIELRPGTTVFVSGAGSVEGDGVRAHGGALQLLVRSRAELRELTLLASGDGRLQLEGQPPLLLPRSEASLRLPLEPASMLWGRRGLSETLYRSRVVLAGGSASLRFAVEQDGATARPPEARATAGGRGLVTSGAGLPAGRDHPARSTEPGAARMR